VIPTSSQLQFPLRPPRDLNESREGLAGIAVFVRRVPDAQYAIVWVRHVRGLKVQYQDKRER
jgi:hypothetical protein